VAGRKPIAGPKTDGIAIVAGYERSSSPRLVVINIAGMQGACRRKPRPHDQKSITTMLSFFSSTLESGKLPLNACGGFKRK